MRRVVVASSLDPDTSPVESETPSERTGILEMSKNWSIAQAMARAAAPRMTVLAVVCGLVEGGKKQQNTVSRYEIA